MSEVPRIVRITWGLHLAWGLVVIVGSRFLGAGIASARPVLVAAWFGTSTMLMIYTLVVASGGWRRNESRYLTSLLIFDATAVALVIDLLKAAS